MKGKPDLRLMARSGVPVGKLLSARLDHRESSPWSALEFGIAIGLIAIQVAAACWLSNLWIDALGF